MNNPIFQNDYGVNPPTNESYNEVIKYKRKLEIAVSNKITDSHQHASELELQAKRQCLEIQVQSNEDIQRVNGFLEQKANEEGADTMPLWFSNWANRFASDMSDLKGDMSDLKGDMSGLSTALNRVNFRIARIENKESRASGFSSGKLPFLNGQEPDEDLPPILNIEDIENLTREECVRYLRGYGVSFTNNETISLKKKLRDAIGFTLRSDSVFDFHSFRN
ncbi:DEHA2D19096p [Debaryomyces hansenii CBS767]|uniref:DEHA2D19096p n=1 Tax=Debaryomyces hansenii (strain ATCC 36239 / CBS 767 / BCRC 21394 / JCM 1990 / NBRC 0083 / IGC 2968) TaxID=284592 RepID=B5RTN5_DEBHA|nr:DEHA2D19096p [Debaryomyces hansenii CBS767]CAR65720.1 DEHA2D19096p [Debaryomyces hansenii CBS767]|eukprot:XP_002770366.1 DEHA2D19096p [Debaryomyces hansenii CBS767]